MNYDAEIAALKARVDALEDEQESKSQKLTIWGIVVAVIVGGIQIAIALFSKGH